MTNLYILRHASAGVRRINPLLDVNRPLDRDGKQHCLQLAHVLNAQKTSFDLIVSSPLKRCLQTASLIGTETGYEAKILLSQGLAPAATLDDFYKLLKEVQAYESVLVVGHNPNLAQFLGAMLVPAATGATATVRLRKGTIARLSTSRGPAMLQWMLDPRTVKALYTTSTRSSRRKVSRK